MKVIAQLYLVLLLVLTVDLKQNVYHVFLVPIEKTLLIVIVLMDFHQIYQINVLLIVLMENMVLVINVEIVNILVKLVMDLKINVYLVKQDLNCMEITNVLHLANSLVEIVQLINHLLGTYLINFFNINKNNNIIL